MGDLAVIVPKPQAEGKIAALRSEGVYDDSRSVRAADDGTIELPVTEPPTETAVIDVVEQVDPVPRVRGLDDRLRQRGWTDAELDRIPRSWSVVGDVVLARFPADCPDPIAVGEALAELHGAETVLDRAGVAGPTRTPDVSVMAGSGDTEVVHVEHGTRYALDLAEVMFSPGNKAERVRMGAIVEPGEQVLDAFAGIGYFSLPMARAGADVTAVELNPKAFRYLIENAVLNDVTERIDAILGDCRDIVGPNANGAAVPGKADRAVLGHFDAVEHLDTLLPALAPGGIVHLHAAVPMEEEPPDEPAAALVRIVDTADRAATVLAVREVKSYAPGISHVVVDAEIE